MLKQLYRFIVPEKIRYKVLNFKKASKLHTLKKEILRYYQLNPTNDEEINSALVYLKSHPMSVFPSAFSEKYQSQNIQVLYDDGLPYVMFNENKLYFKKSLSVENIQHAFSFLLCEQDPASPHCYLSKDFVFQEASVLADVGCAEGIFTLMNIDKIKHAYLFEADKDWLEPLKKTFAPWENKITIINKFVGEKTSDDFLSLDDYFLQKEINFLKIDVDGAEESLLAGARQLIQNTNLQIALCTYHKQDDALKFDTLLKSWKYETRFTKNYMLFFFEQPFHAPYFRKAILRAKKIW